VQLDKLKGRTLACRAKFQQNWGNYGVQQVKGDDEIIKKIIEHFPKDEVYNVIKLYFDPYYLHFPLYVSCLLCTS
jgi:hypothetical protein